MVPSFVTRYFAYRLGVPGYICGALGLGSLHSCCDAISSRSPNVVGCMLQFQENDFYSIEYGGVGEPDFRHDL